MMLWINTNNGCLRACIIHTYTLISNNRYIIHTLTEFLINYGVLIKLRKNDTDKTLCLIDIILPCAYKHLYQTLPYIMVSYFGFIQT